MENKQTVRVSIANKDELLKLIDDVKEKATVLDEAMQRLNEFKIEITVEN